jgi:hypothetical protein
MTRKKVILRGLLGFPLGISIGFVITIIISLILDTGEYLPIVPSFATRFSNELTAVILQTVLCGVIGTAFCAASVIWQLENWSIAKQTGLYFLITSVVLFPIAYFTEWMAHSVAGFLIYFGFFALQFALIWVIQYLIWKYHVKRMNERMKGEQHK